MRSQPCPRVRGHRGQQPVTVPCHPFRVNRTDRLHALSEELRRAGPADAPPPPGRLARGEHPHRQARRLGAAAGRPAGLGPERPGGGYVLDARATLAPVNLTPAQAIAAPPPWPRSPTPRTPRTGRVALEKVLDVMAPADRRASRSSGPASGSGPRTRPRWSIRARGCLGTPWPPAGGRPHLRRRRREVDASPRGTPPARSPGEHWYLVGCAASVEVRAWFRYDRVRAAHLTPEAGRGARCRRLRDTPQDAHPVRR